MLGRAAGLTEEQLAAVGSDTPPDDLFDPAGSAILRYAYKSTKMKTIDDATYAAQHAHFDDNAIIEICFTGGLSNMINRFHATFLTTSIPLRTSFTSTRPKPRGCGPSSISTWSMNRCCPWFRNWNGGVG